MMLKFYFSAALAQVVRNGGCQYDFEDWTGCQYVSKTECQRTRKVTRNIDLHLLQGKECTVPGFIPTGSQGRENCACTEEYSEQLACGYEFSEWTGCARVGPSTCARTRLITKNEFLFTEGLSCYPKGVKHPAYGTEACTNCDDPDPVKDCGYKFNAWTQCARNPYVTDGSCHQTRTLESSNAQITTTPCYGANQKIPGELGEKVCPCPAGANVGATCSKHADCESQLCHTTTKQCVEGEKHEKTAGCLYQVSAWETCKESRNQSGTCDRARKIEAVSRERAFATASCFQPVSVVRPLTLESCECPAGANIGATCAKHTDCESQLCHTTTKQCVEGEKNEKSAGCLYQVSAWETCKESRYQPGTCDRARKIEAVSRERAFPTASCFQPVSVVRPLTLESCECSAGTGVTGNAEPRECRGNGMYCLAGTTYTTWMKANCKQTCATYLVNPPVVDTWIGNCATYKDNATPNGKTYCTDEDFSSWQKLCMKTCQ